METLQHEAGDRASFCEIQSSSRPACYLCGSGGHIAYKGLRDGVFGAPGLWTLRRCPDPKCGLMWLDPMPLEEEIAKAYTNYYTHEEHPPVSVKDNWLRRGYRLVKKGYLAGRYGYHASEEATWWRAAGLLMYLIPIRRASVDAEILRLAAKSNGRLLDVGCGSGQLLARMASLGWQVEGLDPDWAAVEVAVRKGLKVRQGTVHSHHFPTGSFDVVVLSHVIEHVHDPLALIVECYRIIAPGGSLVMITPNAGSWGHQIYKGDWRGLEPPRHLHIFTVSSLAAISVRAGFRDHRWDLGALTRSILLASHFLRLRGKVTPEDRPSVAAWFWTQLITLGELVFFHVRPSIVEEIFQISRK